MKRVLVVIGYQDEKFEYLREKDVERLSNWISANQGDFDYTISIVREAGNRNIEKSGMEIIDNTTMNHYPFEVHQEITVHGYDLDCSILDENTEYYIVGTYTAEAILCTAMSMYSMGMKVKVIENYCLDRRDLHKNAINIMMEYMKDCVIR